MTLKKTIAIIGATEEAGREIATKISLMPYRLLLVAHNTDLVAQLIKKITYGNPAAEIHALDSVKDGCWEADIIILAVPAGEQLEVARLMKEVTTQKTVIVCSISNMENTVEQLQTILPYSKLVKVFRFPQKEEIIVSGTDAIVDKEILKIFNSDHFHSGDE